MNYLELPSDIKNQLQTFRVHAPVASGSLDISLERKNDEVIVSGKGILKGLGGFVTPVKAETQSLLHRGPTSLSLSNYRRELKIFGQERNIEATQAPAFALDHVAMVFAVQCFFERASEKDSTAKVFLYDGKRAIDLYVRRDQAASLNGAHLTRLEISKDEAFSAEKDVSRGMLIEMEESTSRIVQIVYSIPALGKIEIVRA